MFLISNSVISQNLGYGPLIGSNFYGIDIKGSVSGGSGGSYFNFGGFVDYKFNNKLGVKSYLMYTNTQENSYYDDNIYQNVFNSAELKTLQLHALCKFDVRKDYNKGFYFVGGFRVTDVLTAESDKNEDLSNFYEKVNYGGLFGFGTAFLKNFSFEVVFDYSLSDTVTANGNESKNLGCYGNLLFNIEPLFNKKR